MRIPKAGSRGGTPSTGEGEERLPPRASPIERRKKRSPIEFQAQFSLEGGKEKRKKSQILCAKPEKKKNCPVGAIYPLTEEGRKKNSSSIFIADERKKKKKNVIVFSHVLPLLPAEGKGKKKRRQSPPP